MKMKKKMSLLLILTMLMSLLPVSAPVLAAEVKIQCVESPLYGGVTTGATIYFGQYTKKDDSKAPILWRVMGAEDEKATLLSDKILEYRLFDSSGYKNWVGSDLCKYLNGDFLTAAFTAAEQGDITTYSNVQEQGSSPPATFTPNQKVVLPSVNEVQAGGAFGWNQNSDRIAQDADGYRGTPEIDKYWWLRSEFNNSESFVTCVSDTGNYNAGGNVNLACLGIRPALKLNLQSVLFTSDAFGAGAKTGTPNSMLNGIAHTSNEIKLTLIDPYNASTNPTGQNVDISSRTYKYIENHATEVEVNYSNATTGENQYLSAMITDNSGALKYYGPIKSLIADPSGTAKVTIPNDFGENWRLKIFTEELNGDYQTDYASAPVDVSPVAPSITTTSLSSGTEGIAYSQTLTATGDSPITWSLESGKLPAGLSLDAATGAISGTPTTVGESDFTVKAANGVNPDATQALSITINTAPLDPVITYSVIFDSNGGSAVAPITGITSGSTITLPITTRSSYTFAGWFEGTTQYISTTPILKDVSLVAKWERNKQGGGSSGGGSSSTPKTTEQIIDQLSQKDKETILQNFKEPIPYTSLSTKVMLEELKKFTNNKFSDEQLQELLGNPKLLEKLGIDESMLSKPIVLKPIKNATFTDVPPTHWANNSIKEATELGLAAGMPDGSFAPSSPLQVADTLTFLDRVLLLNGVTKMKLSRSTVEKYITQKDHWAFFSMASIGSKLSEETLKSVSELGDKPFSRELLAQVLYEITEGKLNSVREEVAFVDIADSPYKEAINYCSTVGLLSGMDTNRMAPNKALTRGELMSVLIRLNNKLK